MMTESTYNRNDVSAAFRRVFESCERDSRLIQALIDASGSSIVVLDEDRTIVFANRSWRQFAAQSGAHLGEHGEGKAYPDLFQTIVSASHDDARAIRNGIQRIIDNEEIEFRLEYWCSAFARPVRISMHASSIAQLDPADRRLILVHHDDVSTEKSASDELRTDSERLRRLLKTSNVLPWEANAGNKVFTYVGDQSDDLLGYSPEECMQEGFWASHIYAADRHRVTTQYSDLSKSSNHFRSEYRMVTKDGRVIWIQDMVDVVREGVKPPTMHGVMTDISDRKQAEGTLAELSGRLITAQEEERKRIARELHDDLNQRIALISIELEQISQKLKPGPDGLSVRLKSTQRKVFEISNTIHRMSYELHPSKLDHLGLAPALSSFCVELSKSRGIQIDFRHEGRAHVLPRNITLCIFRIAQEALQNAAKYSGAPKVEINLTKRTDSIELLVSDDGNGFDTNSEKMTKGLGFISMRERVRLVGGELRISSKPSGGTRIQVTVPLKDQST